MTDAMNTTSVAVVRALVASVWLVHGLYHKLMRGSPRHLAIVQSVPGLAGTRGARALTAIGWGEVAIAIWVLSGWRPVLCAATQTTALFSMNALELTYARRLLLVPAGLVPLTAGFLALGWLAAGAPLGVALTAVAAACASAVPHLLPRLRRHPIPIEAGLEDCVTLTFALPPSVLRPLLPPGLELETFGGLGYVAVALVR